MATNYTGIDWAVCLAWSLGHAVLTALVGHTAVNSVATYDSFRVVAWKPARWVGGCKTCRAHHHVDGAIATGRTSSNSEQVVISGVSAYRTADMGTNPCVIFASCPCGKRVKLERVYDAAKPGRLRHECGAKCRNSTGPACECKCKGANHGKG